jgi:hypothetical protein
VRNAFRVRDPRSPDARNVYVFALADITHL